MADKPMKRRADIPRTEEELTPTGKKLKATHKSAVRTTAQRTRSSVELDTEIPIFSLEEPPPPRMPGEDNAGKPPSAEEFRNMLRDGLESVAKKDQINKMIMHIRNNSDTLISLERKVTPRTKPRKDCFDALRRGSMPILALQPFPPRTIL